MALPNMARTLVRWQRPVTIKTVTKTTVDFQPTVTVAGRTQECVVQVAEKSKLNPDTIDWSRAYLMVHSSDPIEMGELVEFNGEDYLVVERGAWEGYGYTEVLAEQTKKPLVEVTP